MRQPRWRFKGRKHGFVRKKREHRGRYETIQPDEHGRVYSPSTGLYLAGCNQWLRWVTPQGVIVPTPQELAEQERQRANQAEGRANQAEGRANQAQQRAEEAEQLLAKYRQQFGKLE